LCVCVSVKVKLTVFYYVFVCIPPGKAVPEMTYTVSSGTLTLLTHSLIQLRAKMSSHSECAGDVTAR